MHIKTAMHDPYGPFNAYSYTSQNPQTLGHFLPRSKLWMNPAIPEGEEDLAWLRQMLALNAAKKEQR